jgi:hypothetical protein
MHEGSYPRLLGFFAVLYGPSFLIGGLFGVAAMKRAMPALVAIPLAALAGMALVSGSVWSAQRGGNGAYKVSRLKEPFGYWATVSVYAACSIGALFLYAR